MKTPCIQIHLVIVAASLWTVNPTMADWPICTESSDQYHCGIVESESGGAIISWWDVSDGQSYAQRIDSSGVRQWAPAGVHIDLAQEGYRHKIAPDMTGGAIAAHVSATGPLYEKGIFVQRINVNGTNLWGSGGVLANTWLTYMGDVELCVTSDGEGGAILAWDETPLGLPYYVKVARISSVGQLLWSSTIYTGVDYGAHGLELVSDGQGGVFLTWTTTNDPQGGCSVRAQRVNAAGQSAWAVNGAILSSSSTYKEDPHLVADGIGGCIVAWLEVTEPQDNNIYAQRLFYTGDIAWSDGGVPISEAMTIQGEPFLVPDESGGAIITWSEYDSDAGGYGESDIYAQRITQTGTVLWTSDGILVSGAPGSQTMNLYSSMHPVVPDGESGAIIVWYDNRNEDLDLYAQRISASGYPQWQFDGSPVCTAEGTASWPSCIAASDGRALVSWSDPRYGDYDIYAIRIPMDPTSVEPPLPRLPDLFQNYPNPFNPLTIIEYAVPTPGHVRLAIYDVHGRLVRKLADQRMDAGYHQVTWDGTNDQGRSIASGMYFYRAEIGEETKTRKMLLIR
jgi:hypothetical protein